MIKRLNHEDNLRLTGMSIELDATIGDDSIVLDQENGDIEKRLNR